MLLKQKHTGVRNSDTTSSSRRCRKVDGLRRSGVWSCTCKLGEVRNLRCLFALPALCRKYCLQSYKLGENDLSGFAPYLSKRTPCWHRGCLRIVMQPGMVEDNRAVRAPRLPREVHESDLSLIFEKLPVLVLWQARATCRVWRNAASADNRMAEVLKRRQSARRSSMFVQVIHRGANATTFGPPNTPWRTIQCGMRGAPPSCSGTGDSMSQGGGRWHLKARRAGTVMQKLVSYQLVEQWGRLLMFAGCGEFTEAIKQLEGIKVWEVSVVDSTIERPSVSPDVESTGKSFAETTYRWNMLGEMEYKFFRDFCNSFGNGKCVLASLKFIHLVAADHCSYLSSKSSKFLPDSAAPLKNVALFDTLDRSWSWLTLPEVVLPYGYSSFCEAMSFVPRKTAVP